MNFIQESYQNDFGTILLAWLSCWYEIGCTVMSLVSMHMYNCIDYTDARVAQLEPRLVSSPVACCMYIWSYILRATILTDTILYSNKTVIIWRC